MRKNHAPVFGSSARTMPIGISNSSSAREYSKLTMMDIIRADRRRFGLLLCTRPLYSDVCHKGSTMKHTSTIAVISGLLSLFLGTTAWGATCDPLAEAYKINLQNLVWPRTAFFVSGRSH